MLITNHVLSGALLGAHAPDAGTAFGRGFASHFALDVVPHFGVDDQHLLKIAVPDGLLGLAVIATVVRATPRHRLIPVLAGITGACLPDLDKPGKQFFGRSPFPSWFDWAHTVIQPESPRRFPVEVAAATLLGAALAVSLRRSR